MSAAVTPSSRPGAVLFVCTRNAVRSAMAEALAQELQQERPGSRIYVDSAGLDPMDVDGFAVTVLNEWQVPLERHQSKSVEDVDINEFDLVVSLSPEASLALDEYAVDLEVWPVDDPGHLCAPNASRDERLEAYRAVRDQIRERIEALLSR